MARCVAAVFLLALSGCVGGAPDAAVGACAAPRGGANAHYPGNRAPLQPSALVKLPLGAVRPAGWLHRQLELQNAGFHGHLAAISRFLDPRDNAWLSPTGQGDHGWEEVPYWLKGFLDCAVLLGDEAHVAEARRWIEGAIASQQPDGWFGPRRAKSTVASTEGDDLWPNMVMLCCLQSFYEFTGDPRVPDLMRRYFRWELAVPDERFLPPYWQHQRGGDNLWSVYWLYDRTGEDWLLELAAKIHRCMANWTDGVPDWHNVNMSQAFGEPAYWAMQSDDAHARAAAERNWRTFRERFGQVPGGMFGGDENCRIGFTDPRQAIETCGMVEMMFSCERLLQATGDAVWGDRCEDVAFNSLPAALTADLKALRYLTAPNQPLSDRASKAPGVENGGPMFAMDPHDHRCCQHNFGHGWPYFVEHLWMAAPDGGLAAPLYGPCTATATVGPGAGVAAEIVEDTHYPFGGDVELTLHLAGPARFPLFLRVPAWCDAPVLALEGVHVPTAAGRGARWLRVERDWPAGASRVRLVMPMAVALRRWEHNGDSVSVDRGPLTYSLAIGERYGRDGGTDDWPAWTIEPMSDWNFGLWRPTAAAIRAIEKPWPADDMPFTQDGCPIELRALGKRIAGWGLDPTGLVEELAPSPVASDAPLAELRLLPMGACRLRISSFPVVDDGPGATAWPPPPAAWSWQIAASHCYRYDTPEALRDGKVPGTGGVGGAGGAAEPRFPRFTWWDHKGTLETVDYTFPRPREVSRVAVWWFDDQPGGGCAVPRQWRVLVRAGEEWQEVRAAGPYGTGKDGFQEVAFAPVTTTAIRLEVRLQDTKSGGLYEWRVE
ncbi:MAG: glycoside hydrolase family 127 protein [Planctomycetota bacterium]